MNLNPTNIVWRPPMDNPDSARPLAALAHAVNALHQRNDVLAQLRLEGLKVSSACRGWLR